MCSAQDERYPQSLEVWNSRSIRHHYTHASNMNPKEGHAAHTHELVAAHILKSFYVMLNASTLVELEP